MSSELRSIVDIDDRVESESFAELRRHWRLFRQRHSSLDEIDPSDVDDTINSHIRPNGWVCLVLSLLVGLFFAWWLTEYSFWFVRERWLVGLLFGWTAINLTMLAFHGCTLVRRHWLFPMEQLIGRKLALVLRHIDYRSVWQQSPHVQSAHQKLRQLGINTTWDNPQYVAAYQKQSEWHEVPLRSAREQIHSKLVDFLGRKDPETRRFQPGKYLNSLINRKQSVTRFVQANQTEILASKQNELAESRGIALLEKLLNQELTVATAGEVHLRRWIESAKRGSFQPAGVLVAEIWQRDPWIDLTHQQEFFSSASLRGVRRVGRGTKGRMGPFLYLDDPAVSALDISDNSGRKVRARIAAAVTTEKDGVSIPVLYVDGIEGTNSVDRRLVIKAITDYGQACGFRAVLVHKYPHNQVPRFFLRELENTEVSVVADLAYVVATKRQYLDGFGWPIEPFDYAFPAGDVSAYVIELDGPVEIGRRETVIDRGKASSRRAALWLILSSALGYAAFTTTFANPWLLPGLVLFAALGIAAQLWVQNSGLRHARA